MSECGSLFLEAWKAGVELSVEDKRLHLAAPSKPPDELLEKLQTNKAELLRFLSCWIDTPFGQAKFWGFVCGDRCGVVLRNQPDRVTFINRSELAVRPSPEDRAAVVQ